MYNEEEINDSLEFCRDIGVYYEKDKENNPYESYLKKKASRENFSVKRKDGSKSSCGYPTEESEVFFKKAFSNLWGLLLVIFLAYGISSFITNYCIWYTQVDGISMEPALEDGDRLVIDKLSYHFHEPERFDIVVFPQALDVYYVKRIIGLPGETVQIINGKIYIDDMILVENYGNEPMEEESSMNEPVTLGENQYFVLGDNRNYSIDSRDPSVGLVSGNYVVGKVIKWRKAENE